MSAPADARARGTVGIVPVPHRVTAVRRETADTTTIALAPLGGQPPPFAPGQVDMLYAFGIGEVPISISSGTRLQGRREYTIRDVGPVTHALTSVSVGSHVGVRGPFGRPWPLEDARGGDVLVIAGGIGLAPMRAAILSLIDDRDAYDSLTVLYGARQPADILYEDQLERWRARPGVDVGVTVDVAGPGWHGDVGVVTGLIPAARVDLARATALVCGPEIMMRLTAEALLERGIPADRVFVTCERNMLCGVGTCGHCQLGPFFVCADGPVFSWDRIGPFINVREL